MKILLSASRVRSIIADARTDKDLELMLRAHKVRYTYTTETGHLAVKVPTRTGAVYITRAPRVGYASRSARPDAGTVRPFYPANVY